MYGGAGGISQAAGNGGSGATGGAGGDLLAAPATGAVVVAFPFFLQAVISVLAAQLVLPVGKAAVLVLMAALVARAPQAVSVAQAACC